MTTPSIANQDGVYVRQFASDRQVKSGDKETIAAGAAELPVGDQTNMDYAGSIVSNADVMRTPMPVFAVW